MTSYWEINIMINSEICQIIQKLSKNPVFTLAKIEERWCDLEHRATGTGLRAESRGRRGSFRLGDKNRWDEGIRSL